MSADINTRIKIKGNRDDVIKFVKEISNNKFLKSATLNSDYVDKLDDNELCKIIKNENIINAMGPYGQYENLKDTKVFEDLVDKVPNVEFDGEMNGFIYETNVSLYAKYKKPKLEVKYSSYIKEYEPYLKYIESKISKSKFCKLFCIEDLDEESFEDFFTNEEIDFVEYDTFMNYFEDSEIDEDDFYDTIKKLSNLGIKDLDSFSSDNGESGTYTYECNSRTEKDKLTTGQIVARQISSKPEKIEISDKSFVHTLCLNEYSLEKYIKENNGIIKDAISSKVDYLIIGDNCFMETSKIKNAKELKEKGKTIIAMSQSEFDKLKDK